MPPGNRKFLAFEGHQIRLSLFLKKHFFFFLWTDLFAFSSDSSTFESILIVEEARWITFVIPHHMINST